MVGVKPRAAIVTGASSGLGAAIAERLAADGLNVALIARRVHGLDATRSKIAAAGGRAITIQLDVTDPDACEAAVEEIVAAFGQIDVLVNNAGTGAAVPATREQPQEFRSVLEVNLMGAYWMAQSCARRMARGSSIVNISSVLAQTTAGLPQAAYTASKAGLEGLTRDLAQQWTSRKGIRVNAVAPGLFPTEMTEEYPPGYIDRLVKDRVLMGRLGELSECAEAVAFLASRRAGYITGAVLPVDGGLRLT